MSARRQDTVKAHEEQRMCRLDTQGHCPSVTSSFSSRGFLTPSPSSPSYYERRPSLASSWSEESAMSGYSFGSSQLSSSPSTPAQEEREVCVADFGQAEGYPFEDLAMLGALAQPQIGGFSLHGEYPMTPPNYKSPIELPGPPCHWDPIGMALDGATAPAGTIDPALTSAFNPLYPEPSPSTDTPVNNSFASMESVLSPLEAPAFWESSETYTGQTATSEVMSGAGEDYNLASPSPMDDKYASGNPDDFLLFNDTVDLKPRNYISRSAPSRPTRIRRPSRQSNNIRHKHGRERCGRLDLKHIPEFSIIPDSEGAKPHKCDMLKDGEPCPARFKRAEHLKRHQKSKGHSPDTPFHCHGCEKRFGRSDNFAQHKRTHMVDKGRNPYIEGFVFDP